MPISLSELKQAQEPWDLQRLSVRGGFPEPYFEAQDLDAERWRMQYTQSILSTDIFEIDHVKHIKALQLLFRLLQNRVGSPISYQSLSEDLSISPATVKQYIQILEALFVIFKVVPYSHNIARSLLKEPKIYFFDTGLLNHNPGAQFENLIALSLLKHAYAVNDYQAKPVRLHYLRTKDGHEVDFALATQDAVTHMVEVKLSDAVLSKSLHYFHEKYQYPGIQVVQYLSQEYQQRTLQVLKAENFLQTLFL